jgi:hypothetical protein
MDERAREGQQEEMVRQLVQVLKRRGYEGLQVEHLEAFAGNRPAVIYWENTDQRFTPDIVGKKGKVEYLFQVESAETLPGASAGEKIALFAAYARHYRKQFCLAVPELCLNEARRRLLEMQVDERFTHLIALPKEECDGMRK